MNRKWDQSVRIVCELDDADGTRMFVYGREKTMACMYGFTRLVGVRLSDALAFTEHA